MIKLNLQFFGGRGATSGGSTGGSVSVGNTTSLISERESKPTEVDQTLQVLKDVNDRYGSILDDVQIVTLNGRNQTLAYYDNKGNLAVNSKYFDAKAMDKSYDDCIKAGFHPERGAEPENSKQTGFTRNSETPLFSTYFVR